jgi:hypothetical protein
MPEKLAQMKELFAMEAAKNKALPIGGGLWVAALPPELRQSIPYKEWSFSGDITQMPRFSGVCLASFALCVRSNRGGPQVWRVMFSRPYGYRLGISPNLLVRWLVVRS